MLFQAESILAVTHGRSHEVYKELAELLDQCAEQRRMVLEQDEEDTATQEAYQSLLELRNQIFEDPSQDLNDWAKRLRQANFKQTWRLRHC